MTTQQPDSDLGYTLGFWVLRLWLGIRALVTGIEKFAGTSTSEAPVMIDGEANAVGLTTGASAKTYGFDFYHGVPTALYSKLQDEPLIPGFLLGLYDLLLGPALIVLGLTVLLGIATRISLFAMGLVYVSLTMGLILLKQDAGVAWLGIHIIMIAMALFFVRYNRWQVFSRL